jgi:beta-glucosidase
LTSAAPSTQNVSRNPSDYLFPANFTRVPLYIYPYLNTTNPNAISNTTSRPSPNSDPSIPPNALSSSPQPIHPAGGAPGGNPQLYDVLYQVEATIRNTGSIGGEEVPQLYISLGGASDPRVVLRGFQRLSINPGSFATFHADITRRDISNWDPVTQNWVITNYTKTVHVGSSSRRLQLTAVLPQE